MSKFQKFLGDPAAYIDLFTAKYAMIGFQFLCTCITRVSLAWKGVHVGSGCKFIGIPVFRRIPYSKIQLGTDCSLRSDSTSNLVGVNHRCIIATFSNTSIIQIGNRVGISGAVIGARTKIIIGDDVLIGANALITDFDWHDPNPLKRSSGGGDSRPVVIGKNVWVGINAIVLKGVSIGDNTVIGANSVVTKDIPSNVIAAGNPCRVVREIN